jgi:hypothetical protein
LKRIALLRVRDYVFSQVLNMSRHRSPWTIFRSGLAILAMVAFAMIAQGCATRQDQSQNAGSIEDYMAQGQNDGYASGYGPYDPYMIGYNPYWARWHPAPVYHYSRGDGDNDCGDGNCGSGNGGHGGLHKPPPGTGTGTTRSGTAPHPMP